VARVLASQDGEWIIATVEGPRTVRTALRQSIPDQHLEHMAEDQLWRIHEEAWPTACAVFGRFGLSIEWAAASPTVSASEAVEPTVSASDAVELLGGDLMQERAPQGFSVSIVSAGLTVERAVDADTAWAILAMVLGREASMQPQNGRVGARA
jgi:hypothetical protein